MRILSSDKDGWFIMIWEISERERKWNRSLWQDMYLS